MATSIGLTACTMFCVECSGELSSVCMCVWFELFFPSSDFFLILCSYILLIGFSFVCFQQSPICFSISIWSFFYLLSVFICRWLVLYRHENLCWFSISSSFSCTLSRFFVKFFFFLFVLYNKFFFPIRFFYRSFVLRIFIQFVCFIAIVIAIVSFQVCVSKCVFVILHLLRFAAIYFRDLIRFQSQRPNGHHSIRFYRNAFLLKPFQNYLFMCVCVCATLICVLLFCSLPLNLIPYSLFHKYTSMFNVHVDLILNDKKAAAAQTSNIYRAQVDSTTQYDELNISDAEHKKRGMRAAHTSIAKWAKNAQFKLNMDFFIDSLKWHVFFLYLPVSLWLDCSTLSIYLALRLDSNNPSFIRALCHKTALRQYQSTHSAFTDHAALYGQTSTKRIQKTKSTHE